MIREVRLVETRATDRQLFRTIVSLGGPRGWLAWNWAWRLRGLIDRALGGPGMRNDRPRPADLVAGETLDFWRIEQIEVNRLLRLEAEMRLPGRAWLEWAIEPTSSGTRLRQTALFAPHGWRGRIYWYALLPIHNIIFSRLANAIADHAEGSEP